MWFHWTRSALNKITDILLTTYSNELSWMKIDIRVLWDSSCEISWKLILEIWKLYCSYTIFQIKGPGKITTIFWNQLCMSNLRWNFSSLTYFSAPFYFTHKLDIHIFQQMAFLDLRCFVLDWINCGWRILSEHDSLELEPGMQRTFAALDITQWGFVQTISRHTKAQSSNMTVTTVVLY